MSARPPFPRPHRDDVLIALAGAVGGLVLWSLGLFNNQEAGREYGDWALLTLAVMCLAELLRRIAPAIAPAIAVAALAGDLFTGTLLATIVMFTDVLYAAVLYGRPRLSRAVLPVSVASTVATTVAALAAYRKPWALLVGVACGLVTVMPAWTAVVIRDHRNAAAAERLRAEQTALLAEMDRVQAVTAERARMARELHDVVANHLSAIAIHATAAQSLDDPEASREALAVIRENSVQGLAEMRRMIGLLRGAEGEEEPSAAPTLDGLDALLEYARRHGTAGGLSFALHDERSDGSLPAPVELAAYRIVQEALTNALKHATPGEVTVSLSAGGGGGPLTVVVTSPYGGPRGPRAPGSGAGLTGMRERVELLGGTFAAGPGTGPDDRGCWEVRAVLPVGEESGVGGGGTKGRNDA